MVERKTVIVPDYAVANQGVTQKYIEHPELYPHNQPSAQQKQPKKPEFGPNTWGIITDIHGNLPALEAALEDIKGRGIKQIACLGDIIGYGGEGAKVARRIMELGIPTCIGNHEEALKLVRRGMKEGGLKRMHMNRYAARSIYRTYHDQLINQGDLIEFLIGKMEGSQDVGGLPEKIKIGKNGIGIHSFREEDGTMRYFMSNELAEKYGIPDKDVVKTPQAVVANPETFTPGVKAILTGHVHIPYAYVFSKLEGGLKEHEFIPQWSIPIKGKRNERFFVDKFFIAAGNRAIIGAGSVGVSREKDSDILKKAKELGNPMMPAYWTAYDPDTCAVKFVEFYYGVKSITEATTAAFVNEGEKAEDFNIFLVEEKNAS